MTQATALLQRRNPLTDPFALARIGDFDVRLAVTESDGTAAQNLRRAVFGAHVPDADAFDDVCDHLLIVDHLSGALAGTTRLLRDARPRPGFYAEAEFDIAPLLARHPEHVFCEVGRTCIARAYRHGPAMHALWTGLAAYARFWGIDVYFGTASFPGADPDRHARALAFLASTARTPPDWSVSARPGRAVPIHGKGVREEGMRRRLPPLLRGYLALGAYISRDAAIDPDFGTLDVLVMTRLADVPAPYRAHFSHSSSKDA